MGCGSATERRALSGQSFLADGLGFVDGPKQRPEPDIADRDPFVQELFHPGRYGNGADAISLADQIRYRLIQIVSEVATQALQKT
jgi:hypothetical protein